MATTNDLILEDNNNSESNLTNEFIDNDSFINNSEYYINAKNYWSTISPTVDGMLGGFGRITNADIRGSTNFLQTLYRMKPIPGRKYALDCGAGIGRVTKHLLLPMYERVDMVEQDKHFCDQAQEFISGNKEIKFGEIYNIGLQDFVPEEIKYDLIWVQWVLGHLKDDDLMEFFNRCSIGLKKNGFIVLKENFTSSDEVEIDATDSSVTRPLSLMKTLIDKAGLRIIKEEKQLNFPKGLYPVYIIAIKSKRVNI